jgi:opacity protein-like surface antigen
MKTLKISTLKISTLVATVVAASALAGTAFADQTDQNNFINLGLNGQYSFASKANLSDNDLGTQTASKNKGLGYGVDAGYQYAITPSFRLGAQIGYEQFANTSSDYSNTINPVGPFGPGGTQNIYGPGGTQKQQPLGPGGNQHLIGPGGTQQPTVPTTTITNIKIKESMVTVLVTAEYFVNPNWDIIGKFGPAWVSQKNEINTGSKNTTVNAHKVAPYLNLGTAYHFENNMSVGVSYGHLFGSKINSEDDLANKHKVQSVNSVQLDLGYTFPF